MEATWVVNEHKVPGLQQVNEVVSPNNIHIQVASLFGKMEKVRYLGNPKDFTWNIHLFASFLRTCIIHPVLKTIYEGGGHLPL